MDRISTTNKATNLFGAGKHGFKDGDLSLGIVPTEFNAAFFNDLQEELVGVIEAAGIVPAAGTRNQVLQALRAAGVHQTPAQFDNTTKAATTAFVQRALGSRSGFAGYNVSTQLTNADIGKYIFSQAATNITLTLPDATTSSAGSVLSIYSNAAVGGVTVAAFSAGQKFQMGSLGQFSSYVVGPTDTITFVNVGGSWYAVDGSALLSGASVFGSSLVVPGYQRLPGGLILQWGVGSAPALTANTVSTGNLLAFPVSFPNAVLDALMSPGNAPSAYISYVPYDTGVPPLTDATSKSNLSYSVVCGQTLAAGQKFRWMALGY